MSQSDPVICVGEGEEERFGVQCQNFGVTIGALWFQEGRLTYDVVAKDAVQPFPEGLEMYGAYKLLLLAMGKRLGFAQFNPAHFGVCTDHSRHRLVDDAVEFGHVWRIAVPAAAAIEARVIADYIAAHSEYPLCVRAAVLHRATYRVGVDHVIADAHSRHWRRDASGGPADEAEVLGTTAAYVHATFADIPFDDREGLRYIRTEAACAVLAQSGMMPWVAQRLAGKGRLGI